MWNACGCAVLCLALAWPASEAAAARKRRKPAAAVPAAKASLAGTVTVKGRIKKVKKRFNPYADVYGGGAGKAGAAAAAEHLCVYLEDVPGTFPRPAAHAVLDQRDRAFTTDLLPVLAGTTVDFTNHDRIVHNVFSYSQPQPFDLGRRAAHETQSRTFDKLPPRGIGVLNVSCEIHSNMRATVLVLRNPFFAVLPESGGSFEFKDVPPGTYTLTGWHPTLQPVPATVTLQAGRTAAAELVMRGEE